MTELDQDREWIAPPLDGDGGGYGKYKGLKVREIAALFNQVARDPGMRSVSAVLRISYEQLEARSHLAISAYAAATLGVLTALLLVATLLVGHQLQPALLKGSGLSAVLFVGFGIGAIGTRRQTKAAFAQHRAIAQLAIHYLDLLTADQRFQPKPLDSLQTQTLRRLIKETKTTSPTLTRLLHPNQPQDSPRIEP